MRLAGQYPDRLAGASAHSVITDLTERDSMIDEPQARRVIDCLLRNRAILPPLRFDCGLSDALLASNWTLHQALTSAGVGHIYEAFPGGHDWPYWSEHLSDSLKFLEAQLPSNQAFL